MKGATGAAVWLIVLIMLMFMGFMGIYMYSMQIPAAVPVTYDGEFKDVYLATKGWFSNSFSEQVDANITNDVIGYDWNNAIYRTITPLNATSNPEANDKDLYFPIVFEIDGNVGDDTKIDIDTGAGTQTTGVPTDDITLVDAKVYTHEDSPSLLYDLQSEIEDHQDIDSARIGPLSDGEYVLYVKWHTLSISPAFTTGDDIARITIDLDTTGDVDTAQITVESA